jgi:nicotinamidase-related amidase
VTDVLLVIDVQRALLDELAPPRRAELVETLVYLLNGARSTGVPVVYVRHDGSPTELIPGTPEWEIASEVAPRAAEAIVDKRSGDAFTQTTLRDVLAALDADHLIVSGMQTDFCVNATIGGAVGRGYRVTLVADGHATSASNGKSEQQIREAMHTQTRARGVGIISAAGLYGRLEEGRR